MKNFYQTLGEILKYIGSGAVGGLLVINWYVGFATELDVIRYFFALCLSALFIVAGIIAESME